MQRWLVKTEPDCYSFEDLVREKRTTWDGVTNALAQKHIRSMKKGDELFIYHTGKVRAVIGTAKVISAPRDDDDGLAVVDVVVGQALKHPVSLADIKSDPAFEGWELVRISRLSVMPVPEKLWKHIEKMSEESPAP